MALRDQHGILRETFNRLTRRERALPTEEDVEDRAAKLVPRSKFGRVSVAIVPAEKEPEIRARKPLDVNAKAFKI